MKRWIGFIAPIAIILILTSFGKLPFLKEVDVIPDFLVADDMEYAVISHDEFKELEVKGDMVSLGNTYIGFKEALAFKESQGKYDTINRLGYLGKYQFGRNTLVLLGITDIENFLKEPELQDKAFKSNIARNKWILRRDIKRFAGKRINGAEITESGIVAAAHLAGAGNVKKYLRSYGKENFSDAFGSSVAYYMKKFSGYDISHIKQQRNAKVH